MKCNVNRYKVMHIERSPNVTQKMKAHTENEGIELTINTQKNQEWPGQADHIFLYQ